MRRGGTLPWQTTPGATIDGGTIHAPVHWMIDDTGFPKNGTHSVGVARQYGGQRGKQHNCPVAVALSIATAQGSLPVGYRLYLPREWSEDGARCEKVGVPEATRFETKPALAMRQIGVAGAVGCLYTGHG